MSTLYITCGIPGSGKSTWARKMSANLNWRWISRDAIRFAKLKETDDYFAHETSVYDTFVSDIQSSIYTGVENIIADATHLTNEARFRLLSRLSLCGYDVVYVSFNIPIELAIQRNNQRVGRAKVPESIIKRMWHSFEKPQGNVITINQYGEEAQKE